MRRAISRRWMAAVLIVAGVGLSGCAGLATLLDPEFLNAIGLGTQAASLPGEAPAVLVAVENRTSRTIEAFLSYRASADTVRSYTVVVEPGERTATALVCPVTEITLGDVGDLTRVGAIVRLGVGNAEDPIIEVEPFGVLLRETANYNCGDSLTFAVIASGQTRSGFQTIAFVQRTSEP